MILSDKKGSVTVGTAAVLFTMLMLFSIAYQFIRVSIIAGGARDTVRNAVINAVSANYYNSYDGMRDGNSGAYTADNGWTPIGNLSGVIPEVVNFLGLSTESGAYVKKNSGNTEYSITNLQTILQNPDLRSNDIELNIQATYTLNIPVSLFLIPLPQLCLQQSVSAAFEQKF